PRCLRRPRHPPRPPTAPWWRWWRRRYPKRSSSGLLCDSNACLSDVLAGDHRPPFPVSHLVPRGDFHQRAERLEFEKGVVAIDLADGAPIGIHEVVPGLGQFLHEELAVEEVPE